MPDHEYILITAAYNEDSYIRATIDTVLAQTVIPRKWVIVSDGSTDNTDSIIKSYVKQHEFIQYLRREKSGAAPGFVSKVHSIQDGYTIVSKNSHRFIGILDADITLERDYYERMLKRFDEEPNLGIAGGFIHELCKNSFRNRPSNTTVSVAGAIQLFRRECYEATGGHIPLPYGGEDWLCEILARKNGWIVKAFSDIVAYHHKSSIARRGVLKDSIRQGKMDYVIGSHPLFEFAKCVRRARENPLLLRALFRFLGFTWSAVKKDRKAVSEEVVRYLRGEQMKRLRDIVTP